MRIIGITGTLGAGKGVVVDYLAKQYGFTHYSAREFLAEEVRRRGLEVNRDTLVAVGNELRAIHHPGYVIEQLFNEAFQAGKDAVIESIRTVGEIEVLRKYPAFLLLAIDAEPHIRYERIRRRASSTDAISFERFCDDEQREMVSDDPNKQHIAECIKRADVKIVNNGTLDDLRHQIDEVMEK